MSCPTCDHTMHNVGENAEGLVFWCPRCGTVLIPGFAVVGDEPGHCVTKLVERCREFEERRRLVANGDFRPWWTTGIAEAIRPPAERLTPETY